MITDASAHPLPPMPEIGHPESYYVKRAHEAEHRGDVHAREAFKVAQYVTLAIEPNLPWAQKLRYLCHALHRHCVPPPLPDDKVWGFYRDLANLVRTVAGAEALRLASHEDDMYAARLDIGQDRSTIEDEAEEFFGTLVPDHCPEWFNDADYCQIKLIRDQWI